MTATAPKPFEGTDEERDRNRATHQWRQVSEDGDFACMNCAAETWHAAANYPCGAPVPRMEYLPGVEGPASSPLEVTTDSEPNVEIRDLKSGMLCVCLYTAVFTSLQHAVMAAGSILESPGWAGGTRLAVFARDREFYELLDLDEFQRVEPHADISDRIVALLIKDTTPDE